MRDDRKYVAPASKDGFEIAIICALPKEREAVKLLLDDSWDGEGIHRHRYPRDKNDFNNYWHGRIGKFNVVIVSLGIIGKVPAATAAGDVKRSYPHISLALIVGICGGVPFIPFPKKNREVILGDVVISNILIHRDFGRHYSDRFETKDKPEHAYGRPNYNILNLLSSLGEDSGPAVAKQAAKYLRQLQEKNDTDPDREMGKYMYPGADKDKLFEDSYEHKHHDPSKCSRCTHGSVCEESREAECDELGCDDNHLVPRQRLTQLLAQELSPRPRIHVGRMGSGDSVIRSVQQRKALAVKGVIGIEMEGAGVWEQLPCLVIKGVCDYADSHKGKGWQYYAAATAASVAKAVLDEYQGVQGSGRVLENASDHQTIPTPAPFLNAPFQPDDDFVERDEIMSWLQTELNNKGGRAALVGFGGVGKSRLVIRYARNIQKTSPQTYVLWVYAGTQALFIGSFREIAQELSLNGWDDVKADVLRLVLNWLRSGNRQWLMILDNADDINVFDPKPDECKDSDSTAASSTALKPLDFLRRCQNGNILITSRSEKVVRRLGAGLHFRRVEPMFKGQARQLLRHKLATVEDKSGEENLVDALDCIPLAITQAAAYINHLAPTGRSSVRVYLEQFRQSENNQAVLLNHPPEDEASGPVFTTWIITYEHIRKERPSASDLLSLLSFFYHRGIPEWVLERYYQSFETYHPHTKLPQDCLDPLAEDVATLCSYSFVTVVPMIDNRDNQQPSSHSLQMHALVHTCTRHWVRSNDANGKWLGTFIHLLDKEHPDIVWYLAELSKHLATCCDLFPHVDSLIDSDGLDGLDEMHTVRLVELLQHAGEYSHVFGTLERSERLLMKALKLAETKLCKAHKATHSLLFALRSGWLMDYNGTLEDTVVSAVNRLFTAQLDMLTAPAENLTALESYDVATDVLILDANERTDEHEQALLLLVPLQEMKESSPNVPVEYVVGHMVRFISDAPSCDFTFTMFRLVEVIIGVLGCMKRYPEQEALYRAFLERRMHLPDEAWDTLYYGTEEEILKSLCEVLIKQRKFEGAETLLQKMHSEYTPGEVGPEQAAEGGGYRLLMLGQVLFYRGKFEEAEKIFREGGREIMHARNELDFAEPSTCSLVEIEYDRGLGYTLASQGKHGEASDCFRQVLEWSKQLQLLEHPDTLNICLHLVGSLIPLQEYGEAEDILKQCVNLMQRKFNHQVDKRCRILSNILHVMEAQGKEEDEEYYDYQDQLAELEARLASDSDEDDSSEESNAGSIHAVDGSQAAIENGLSDKAQSDPITVGSTSRPLLPSEMAKGINTSHPEPVSDRIDLPHQEDELHQAENLRRFDKLLLDDDNNMRAPLTIACDDEEAGSVDSTSGAQAPDGAQVQTEAGNALTHTLQEVDEPPMDFWINSVWSQMDVPGYGGIFEDEPVNMELPFTSDSMESDVAKRKRRDTRDSVVTSGSTSQEQPSRKVMRTE